MGFLANFLLCSELYLQEGFTVHCNSALVLFTEIGKELWSKRVSLVLTSTGKCAVLETAYELTNEML